MITADRVSERRWEHRPAACPDYVPYSVGSRCRWRPSAGRRSPARCLVRGSLCPGAAPGHGDGVQWFATGQVPGVPPPDPATVGAQAASELQLPGPSLALSPSGTGYVNLAEWLWVDAVDLAPVTHLRAGVQRRRVHDRDGYRHPGVRDVEHRRRVDVTCNGPGTAYNPAFSADAQSTTARTPTRRPRRAKPSPDGNPNDAAFTVTATVTWTVAWTGPNGSAGALPSLTTEGTSSFKVAQIESVNN